ncbi:LysR family transcriptional regulator [Hydrogenophaga sp.]|uniref:LysR family transcriptional regulator n=1 Tax=Hydrogenophaga sp. TaxID=1904254 RepID=UPI0035632776
MTRLTDLELFVRTADLGSLTAAAKAMDWSPAAASAAVKRLEATWGVAVFVRSTRSLRLSTEGERMLPHVRAALSAMTEAQAVVSKTRSALRGELQLSMPSDLGRNILLPWLETFLQRHPDLSLRLHFSDRTADLMRVPLDMAIRYGTLRGSAQVALPLLLNNPRLLVASPQYIARHGTPATVAELAQHEALSFMVGDEVPKTWRLCVQGQWVDAPVQGRRNANDSEVVSRWAVDGLGLAYRSQIDMAAHIAAGRLVHINPHWQGEPGDLHLVVPGRKQVTAAVRALRDHLVPLLAQLAAGSAQHKR